MFLYAISIKIRSLLCFYQDLAQYFMGCFFDSKTRRKQKHGYAVFDLICLR